MIRSAILAALPLLLAGCTPRQEAKPAIWAVRDADTTIWLFGTIHLLPEDVRWDGGPVGDAIRRADLLVTEIPDGDPAAETAAYRRLCCVAGARKPWAEALALTAGAASDVGASADDGVEAVLNARFAGRPRAALETFAGQLAMFDALPAPAQAQLLAAAKREAGDAQASYDRTLRAWSTGEEAGIARSFTADLSPALRAALIDRRNAAWAGWVAARMRQPGRVLVAVGAGHLAGAGGVPALLKRRGYTVLRLQ